MTFGIMHVVEALYTWSLCRHFVKSTLVTVSLSTSVSAAKLRHKFDYSGRLCWFYTYIRRADVDGPERTRSREAYRERYEG